MPNATSCNKGSSTSETSVTFFANASHALSISWNRITRRHIPPPRLSSASKEAWEIFLNQLKVYSDHYNDLTLSSLMDNDVIMTYISELHLSLDEFIRLPSSDIMMLINYYHYVRGKFENDLRSFRMDPTDKYDRRYCEEYLQRFISSVQKYSKVINHAESREMEQNLVGVFIFGLYPLQLRKLVEETKPETLQEVMRSLHSQCAVMDMDARISLEEHSVSYSSPSSLYKSIDSSIFASTSTFQPKSTFHSTIRIVYTSREAFMKRNKNIITDMNMVFKDSIYAVNDLKVIMDEKEGTSLRQTNNKRRLLRRKDWETLAVMTNY